jgi:diguanylate cyclase (GGDEF)-like protein/PAS domain S-box-containing protein
VEASPPPSWRGPAGALAVVGALTLGAHLRFSQGTAGQLTYLAATVGAAVVAWLGVARHAAGARRPWVYVALGVTASAVADAIYAWYVVRGATAPDAGIADVFWLSSYLGLVVGLLLLLLPEEDERVDLDGIIDMAAVATVGLLFVWRFSVEGTVADTSTSVALRALWSAYPLLDAVLLALVFRALASRRARASVGYPFVLGTACWLVADFIYLFPVAGSLTVWLDLGWMAGALLIALAAWQTATAEPTVDAAQGPERVGSWRVALPFVPLLAPIAIETWSHLTGEESNPVPTAVAALALVGLSFTRAMTLHREGERAWARLRSSERHFRALAANSSDAVVVVDASGHIMGDNPGIASMLGHDGLATDGVDMLSVVCPEDLDAARAVFSNTLLVPGEVFSTELRVWHADGSVLWLAARAVNLTEDPDVRGVVVNLHDVTDRKSAEEELAHRAFHDSLTGLANRALFRNRVEHALDRSARAGSDPAIVYIDLDGFKAVNDTLGHDAGDAVLKEVAGRLDRLVRSGDTVARLGGDEFAVLIEHSNRALDEVATIGERILRTVQEPVLLDGRQVAVDASIGVAVGDGDTTATALLRDADIAMYRAKSGGKGHWVRYEPRMHTEEVERLQLEGDLAAAVDGAQLELLYQPVYELEDERLVGFEALLRWHHPALGMIMPDRFIPLAEENGLIVPIGRWVLLEACRTAARWQDAHPVSPPLSMAVNVSARQLASSDLVGHVADALAEAQLEPSSLVLEMTETSLVRDPVRATAMLRELRALGVRLAIDDFGTGYSSLSYLRQFPVDILKIDRSFIDTITDGGDLPPLLRGMLDLGRSLDLEVVAEGIESQVQRDRLREERCVLGQGYLYARPLPAEDAEALLGRTEVSTRQA